MSALFWQLCRHRKMQQTCVYFIFFVCVACVTQAGTCHISSLNIQESPDQCRLVASLPTDLFVLFALVVNMAFNFILQHTDAIDPVCRLQLCLQYHHSIIMFALGCSNCFFYPTLFIYFLKFMFNVSHQKPAQMFVKTFLVLKLFLILTTTKSTKSNARELTSN